MRIHIDDIPEEGIILQIEQAAESFPVLEEIRKTGECVFVSPLKFDLRGFRVIDTVEISGFFEGRVRLACCRCLKEFETVLASRFEMIYASRKDETTRPSTQTDKELSVEESNLIFFNRSEIDLLEGLQEQVVLSLPLRPLCREDCKGLCPRCGADRNEEDCGCEAAGFHPGFEALKYVKIRSDQ